MYTKIPSPRIPKTGIKRSRREYSLNFYLQSILNRLAAPNERGCRLWTGGTSSNGYGYVKIRGRQVGVHRAVFVLTSGIDLDSEVKVMHVCDTPLCGEFSHLKSGTSLDNVRDMLNKGRANPPSGDRNSFTKFSEQEIEAMRLDKSIGISRESIMQDYNISASHYNRVIKHNKRTWK